MIRGSEGTATGGDKPSCDERRPKVQHDEASPYDVCGVTQRAQDPAMTDVRTTFRRSLASRRKRIAASRFSDVRLSRGDVIGKALRAVVRAMDTAEGRDDEKKTG